MKYTKKQVSVMNNRSKTKKQRIKRRQGNKSRQNKKREKKFSGGMSFYTTGSDLMLKDLISKSPVGALNVPSNDTFYDLY